MVTVTDDWLDRLSEIVLGRSDDELHQVAVGTGTGNEATSAQSLSNEVYRSTKDNNDCFFTDEGSTGEFEAHIQVTGGGSTANVSGGTSITEIGVFTKSGDLVVIDEFSGVSIPTGNTEEFVLPGDYTR